ncbi:hypothetical protein [Paenibacillus prosopidis]|uniref:Uncharacterized protein n=2 Tax=Paenibacillus prosopidis TaxID=630520 RepID=A0A368VGX8_9BACL|nr:hypothetical protein [Paenibacillus prosopidis]RCW39903.1 hypothetical protein DFP97_1461 [Paenibacillus prosopidis]
MKRKIAVLLTIVTIVISIFSIWYFTPKRYSETVDGVYYQLGTEGISEGIKVHVDGKLQNHMDGKRTFKTGFSMGGEGTLDFASKTPEFFSAIVPISGANGSGITIRRQPAKRHTRRKLNYKIRLFKMQQVVRKIPKKYTRISYAKRCRRTRTYIHKRQEHMY